MIHDLINSVDELDPRAQTPTLSVSDSDLASAAFVIPIDAPLPNELGDASLPTGTFLERLKYLGDVVVEKGFAFIPISGNEFLALERAWRALQTRKNVYVLTELPGTRYDVLFDQARRGVGLRNLDWPSVAAAMAAFSIEQQRTRDKTPFNVIEGVTQHRENKLPRTNPQLAGAPLVAPEELDSGDDYTR